MLKRASMSATTFYAHFHGKKDAMLAATLGYRRIRDSGPEALPGLAPICTYIALTPFIGAEEACRVANGDGRGRTQGSGQ